MIILGVDTKTIVLKKDTCYCSSCEAISSYKVKRETLYFSIMFLPIVPLWAKDSEVVCDICRAQYTPSNKNLLNIFSDIDISNPIYTTARITKRIAAFVVDLILLLLFTFGLSVFIEGNPELKSLLPNNFIYIFLPCWFLYFFLSEIAFRGYTLGKKLVSLQVSYNSEFKDLDFLQSFTRSLVKTISCLFPPIFCVSYFTYRNRALHDYAAGSVVITKEKY